MVDFNADVVNRAQEAQDFISRAGGLPEIHRVSLGLRAALDQTRAEVQSAVFAGRFLREVGGHFVAMAQAGQDTLTPRAIAAVEAEGEAGHKRETLRVEMDRIEHELFSLLGRLVELRCDLVVSQQDFDQLPPGSSDC